MQNGCDFILEVFLEFTSEFVVLEDNILLLVLGQIYGIVNEVVPQKPPYLSLTNSFGKANP